MTEQRAEQPINPEQGLPIAPVTGRGSERFWKKILLVGGIIVSSALVGGIVGAALRPLVGVPVESSLSYQMVASAIGMIVAGTALLELLKRGKIRF